MKLLQKSFAVCVSVAALGMGPATASAQPALEHVPADARGIAKHFDTAPEGMAAFGTEYVKQISLDMCSWADRPVNSTCTAQNPADAPSTWNRTNAVACGPSTGPLPSTSWYDFSPSAACNFSSTMGCSTQRWDWSDGRSIEGWGSNVIHCPTDPSLFGSGSYQMTRYLKYSGQTIMKVPGFFNHIEPRTVHAEVTFRAQFVYGSNWDLIPPYMTVWVALQVLNASNQWVDVAAKEVMVPQQGVALATHQVEAVLNPGTAVRVVLRLGAGPQVWYGDGQDFGQDFNLSLYLTQARLYLPECIPDMNNPGYCL